MEAWIERAGDVVVVHLKGRVDYESSIPFRNHCVRNLANEKVVFNLMELSFVGSIGITDFVETMSQLAVANGNGIKFAAMASEFRRIFEASEIQKLQIYESADKATLAFQGADVAPLPRLSPDADELIEVPGEVPAAASSGG